MANLKLRGIAILAAVGLLAGAGGMEGVARGQVGYVPTYNPDGTVTLKVQAASAAKVTTFRQTSKSLPAAGLGRLPEEPDGVFPACCCRPGAAVVPISSARRKVS